MEVLVQIAVKYFVSVPGLLRALRVLEMDVVEYRIDVLVWPSVDVLVQVQPHVNGLGQRDVLVVRAHRWTRPDLLANETHCSV